MSSYPGRKRLSEKKSLLRAPPPDFRTLTAEGGPMRIEDYPRPEGDTGIGFHWFPDVFHYHKTNFDTFAHILANLGASWLLLLSEPAKPIPEFFIRGLLERNIEPIIRVYTPTVQAISQQDLRQLCQTYAGWGVHYIHVFNEPNLVSEWAAGEWEPEGLPERFMDYLLPCLETMHSVEGIIPLFTPLSPGGNYLDLDFLKAAFDIINARGKRHLLEKMAVGIHNYAFNRPPDWSQDHLGFRLFRWYDEIIRERVGRSLPQIACENGVRPGEQLTADYPPIDEELHARRSVEMCQLLMENQVPNYVFNNAFWLLATDDHQPFQEHRWFRDTGQPALPRSVAALEVMPRHPRQLGPYISIPSTIRVLMPDGSVEVMDLDEYLKGVVPAEIGVDRPLEALKAQAIAARSYALAGPRHPGEGADVCTTTHCQVWRPEHYARTDQAVEETRGLVAIYPEPGATSAAAAPVIIRAFYFGHCDGHTRNSEDVWMQALPYCRSVECVRPFPELFGHGVGMCQEGASAMAGQGASCEQILTHYYT
ncbi:MAG TPA: SpoIID/LytB domain-containing protein, partial [Anaerolineae bacterium]|nr:SpoIID/LytB domain-containing protein [Anaerolineae bacterium]